MINKSRAMTLFVALLFFMLAGLTGWVVTSPDFGRDEGRTLIERWSSGFQQRLGSVGIFSHDHSRGSRKSSKSKSKGKSESSVGPASVVVVDNRNAPLADVTVTFRSAHKTVKEKTKRNGRVDVKLPPGYYDVTFAHKKYSTEVRTNQQVYGPLRGFSLIVTMQTTVAVKGRVVDEQGKAVAGASVSGQRNLLQQFSETGGVFLDDASYPTVSTDKSGKFVLADVAIGGNTFTASQMGYAAAEKKLDVAAAGLKSELKLVLKRPARLAGRVVDEAMQPLKSVKVTALEYRPYGGETHALSGKEFTVTTKDDGRFELKKLFKDGYYHLKFEHPSFAVMEQSQVAADSAALNVVMQHGGEISGLVQYLDRETTPAYVMVNATAVVGGTTITRSVMSSQQGQYSFERLPYGSYQLSVNYQGLVNEPRRRVTSAKDKPQTGVQLEVYLASKLSGKVVDAFSGDTIPRAEVIVKSSYGSGKARTRQTTVKADAQGNFSFEKLPGGIQQVTATVRDYLPVSGNLEDYTTSLEPGAVEDDHTVFLSQGGTVRGQVVNQDGNGIGDADVQLYVASGSFSSLKVKDLNQTTDGSGFFQLSDFSIGQGVSLYISARKAGFAKNHSDIVELWPAQPESVTQVVMSPGGVITGRVTDENNVPLYGVKITADSREFPRDPSSTEFYTFTDNSGNFLLEHCTPGRLVLVAEHDDYVRKTRSATVLEGRLLSRQNFSLELARNIRGTVADFRGNPIANARVSAIPTGKTKGKGRDTTNKRGEFEISGLGEGTFRLEATFSLDTPDGKQSYTFVQPEAPSGAQGIPVDCDVAPGAVASIKGEDSTNIDNFRLTLRSLLDTKPTQLFRFNIVRNVKGANGQLRLYKIPRGIYSMKIEADGYETWENEEVLIGPGNMTHLPNIRLTPASQITGSVISSTTGKPVQGALVRVLDATKQKTKTVNRIELRAYDRTDILERLSAAFDDDVKYDPDPDSRLVARVRANVVTTIKTNVYGRFNLNDLADGMYTLEFEHPAFRPKRMRNVYVGKKQSTDLGDIELEPGGTVRGRVVDLEGNGISNASVQVKGELQGRNRERSDTGGNFVLRGIGYGDWPITVQSKLDNRKIYAWKRITVRPDETTFVEFVLEISADATGRVKLPDGTPKSGTVRMYAVDENGAALDDYVYTDNLGNGRFNIKNIPPGRYFALVQGKGSKGDFAAWQWADVSRGRNTFNFADFSVSLQGTAQDVLTGESSAKATVQLRIDVSGGIVPGSISNRLRLAEKTNASGKFTFRYLQPGTYRIWAGAAGQSVIPVDAISVAPGHDVRGVTVAVQGGG